MLKISKPPITEISADMIVGSLTSDDVGKWAVVLPSKLIVCKDKKEAIILQDELTKIGEK